MKRRCFKADIHAIVIVLILFICFVICAYTVSGKPTVSGQVYKNVYVRKNNQSARVIDPVMKQNDIKYRRKLYSEAYFNIKHIAQPCILSNEIYKKFLIIYINNSILYAGFLTIISSLLLVLRSIKRKLFEEPYLLHTSILMNYIHKMDDEWGNTSLNHSF